MKLSPFQAWEAMPRTPMDILRRLPPALARAAIVATLPHAARAERDGLIAALLERTDPAGLSAAAIIPIAGWWAELGSEARARMIQLAGDELPRVVGGLRASTEARDRTAAAMIIAEVLHRAHDASSGDGWDAHLAWAADAYPEHRIGAVLAAVCARAHAPGPAVREFLFEKGHASHMALRAAARGQPASVQRARFAAWLGVPALAAVARDRLERSTDPTDLATVFESAHLLRARGRRAELQRLEHPERIIGGDMTASLRPEARRGRITIIGMLAMHDGARIGLLHSAMTDADPGVRAAAVLALRRLPASPTGDEALADFSLDVARGPAIAAMAAMIDAPTASRRRALVPVYQRLTRSPHAVVRAMASRELASEHAASGIATDRLGCPVAARTRLARNRVGMFAAIRENLRSQRTDDVLGALHLAHRLTLAGSLHADLIPLASSADTRVAAMALTILGHESDPGSLRAIRAGLEHTDGRVRASALEALSRREPGDGAFERCMHDDVPRVRAVAIRHLLRRDGAGFPASHALAEMLGDPRPAHRISALWVVERLRHAELAQRVADIAARDDHPAVRERAARCASILSARLRQGWMRRLDEAAGAAPEAETDVTVRVRPVGMARKGAAA